MTLPLLARRGFLGRLAALPILSAGGSSIFARRADAAAAAIVRQIDEAEGRCTAAQQAFAVALAAYESALPRLHPSLNITDQRPRMFRATIERRGFDGETVKRYINQYGYPAHRYVATVYTLTDDLEECPYGPRAKAICRMMRRARKREAAVAKAENAFRLRELNTAVDDAREAVVNLCNAIFEQPATTFATVKIQARALTAYAASYRERLDGGPSAGAYGMQIAAALDRLAA